MWSPASLFRIQTLMNTTPLKRAAIKAPTDNPDFGAQDDAYWTPTRGVATEFTCYEKKPDASGLSVLTKWAGVPKRLMGFTPRMVMDALGVWVVT